MLPKPRSSANQYAPASAVGTDLFAVPHASAWAKYVG